jgi:NADH-quinone oxidoreductase subunit M
MNLLLLLGVPLLTAVAVLLCINRQQVKWISLAGSVAQLGLAFVLLFVFRQERAAGNTAQMLFEQNHPLFEWMVFR